MDPELLAIASKVMTLGATLTDAERKRWNALDEYEQGEYRLRVRRERRAEKQYAAEVRRDVRVHGEPARRHYAAMSQFAQDALGVKQVLACEQHHRRASRPAPVRAHGSRRTTGSGTTSSGESGDSDPEPPGLRLTPGRLAATKGAAA